jgi:hypothetical protein
MATKVHTTLVDDLDGGAEGVETIEFGLDGVRYEIDLGAVNADALRRALTTYVGAARMVGRGAPERRFEDVSGRRRR